MMHRLKFFGEEFAQKMQRVMGKDFDICFIEDLGEQNQ